MVATTGARLLPNSAVKIMCNELIPKAFLLTPNIPEANVLLKEAGKPSVEVQDLEGLKTLGHAVLGLGSTYVLIKGGHLPLTSEYQVAKTAEDKKITANVLVGEGTLEVIETPYQNSKNTHGTGDSLACERSPSKLAKKSRLTGCSCDRLQPCYGQRNY